MTKTETMTPEAADHAAAAAHQAVNDTEQAISRGKRVGLDRLTELTVRARHADLTARATRDQAVRDREQARQEALAALGTEIDTLAEASAEDLAAALADIAGAVDRARRAAAAWDSHLAEVARTARSLGCSSPARGGPREADQRVAVNLDGTVFHGENTLKPLGSRLKQALAHAADGDAVSALAAAQVKTTTRILPRGDHYVRGRGGLIEPVYGDLSDHQRYQMQSGAMTVLNEAQIRAYLAGEPVELTKAQQDAYQRSR